MQVALPSLGQRKVATSTASLSDAGLLGSSTLPSSTVEHRVKSLGQGHASRVKVRSGGFVWPLLSPLPNGTQQSDGFGLLSGGPAMNGPA